MGDAREKAVYSFDGDVSSGSRTELASIESIRFKKGGAWGRRTGLEKVLLLLCVLVFLALIVLVILLVVHKNEDSAGTKERDVCVSRECVSAASRINSYIDYRVDPCDDLYQFACGRWLKENVIPEEKSSFTTFSVLRDHVDVVLKNLLEEPVSDSDLGCVKKAKDLYASCINLDLINTLGDTKLKELLTTTFGGWPLTSDWKEENFDLVDLLTKLNSHGGYSVVTFYTGINNKNSTQRVLKMDQQSFGMPGQKYYQVPRDDRMLKAYENFIYGVANLMGFWNQSTARQDITDLVDFEIQLANISTPDEERRDSNSLYNPMTLRDVAGNYSEIMDWRKYVLAVTSLPGIALDDITDDEILINQSPSYYERLPGILKATPNRTIVNYMLWRLVLQLAGTQGEPYKELIRLYNKELFGITSQKARFRSCTSYTTSHMGLAVGRMFVKDNFNEDAKSMVLDIIDGLQSSFNELVDHVEWMDEETKRVAREKNEFIAAKIGYPEELMNDTYLEDYYSNYTYNKDRYFENVLENKREDYILNMRRLRELLNKTQWNEAPSTVNALYSSVTNQIMFPAGILQPPFFSPTYPKSLNFGGIGMVIGHEITHGFDDRGRQYDKYGNLVQWWSQSAIDKFKEKAQCIVQQYGNFTVTEINKNLNGINTQGENIADNGGLKQSFDAYRDWVSRRGKEEPRLPGLDLSHNQLFFVNFAQLWCTLMRDEDALNRIRTGVHSPGRFRVIGSAQNSPDFAKAFKCPSNSYMNPQKKCSVW